jgi:hypothetical protein
MSRSPHKSSQHTSRKSSGSFISTLAWIIGGFVFLSIIGVMLVGLANRPGVDPNFTPKVTGAPALEVVQPAFDLGDQHFNTTVRVVYNLQNVGDKTLRILKVPQVQVLEGC